MTAAQASATQVGPYVAHLLAGGAVLTKKLPPTFSASGWTEWAWVEVPAQPMAGETLVAGIVDRAAGCARLLGFAGGRPELRLDGAHAVVAPGAVGAGWHLLAAAGDGQQARLYVDALPAGSAAAGGRPCGAAIELDPNPGAGETWRRFGGRVAFSAAARELTEAEICGADGLADRAGGGAL